MTVVLASAILVVLLWCRVAEIHSTIIQRIAVDVIHHVVAREVVVNSFHHCFPLLLLFTSPFEGKDGICL